MSSTKFGNTNYTGNTDSTWRPWLLRGWVILSVLLTSFCLFKGLEASVPQPSWREITTTEEVRRTKRIDEITEQDLVLAREEHGTTIGAKPVVQVFRRTSDHLRVLTFVSEDGVQQTIRTTDEHPFALADSLDFVPASDLSIGTLVPRPQGEPQALIASTREAHPEGIPVFNFEVDDFHTYFVTQNESSYSLLVHNACSIIQNRLNGLRAQGNFANHLRQNGFDVVGEGIMVRTPFGRRELDIVVRINGQLFGIEVKSGGAVRNTAQLAKDAFINRGGALAIGSHSQRAAILG